MLHSTSIDDLGLLHGKIDVAIYFHHLARQSGKEIFAEFADEVIDINTDMVFTQIEQHERQVTMAKEMDIA